MAGCRSWRFDRSCFRPWSLREWNDIIFGSRCNPLDGNALFGRYVQGFTVQYVTMLGIQFLPGFLVLDNFTIERMPITPDIRDLARCFQLPGCIKLPVIGLPGSDGVV